MQTLERALPRPHRCERNKNGSGEKIVSTTLWPMKCPRRGLIPDAQIQARSQAATLGGRSRLRKQIYGKNQPKL